MKLVAYFLTAVFILNAVGCGMSITAENRLLPTLSLVACVIVGCFTLSWAVS